MNNQNKGLTSEEIFKLGMAAGKKQLMDHICHQYAIGKPIEIHGQLFWLKDARQNLLDIMEDLESSLNMGRQNTGKKGVYETEI